MVNKLRLSVILLISIISFNLLTGAESPFLGKRYRATSRSFTNSTFQNSNIFSPKAAPAFPANFSKSKIYGNVLVERGVITAEQMGTLMTQDGGHDELISLYDSNMQAAIEGGPASQKLWEDSTSKAVDQLKSEGLKISMGGQSQGGFFNDLLNSFQQSMGYATDGNGGLDANGEFSISTCFTAGTLVHTKTGTKKIEEIQVGDQVLSWDEEGGETSYRNVVRTFRREVSKIYTITYIDGTEVETTDEHPFYIEGKGWVPAKYLRTGEASVLSNESRLAIQSIQIEEKTATVYNFEVEDSHTYYISKAGILVHNDCDATALRLGAGKSFVKLADGTITLLSRTLQIGERILTSGEYRDLGLDPMGRPLDPASFDLVKFYDKLVVDPFRADCDCDARGNFEQSYRFGTATTDLAGLLSATTHVLKGLVGITEGINKAKFMFDPRVGQYRDMSTGRFISPNSLPWPGNNGFIYSQAGELKAGTVIDRFGSLSGKYAGTPGATIAERGLPPGSEFKTYSKFEVVKPIPMEYGPALGVPDFGAPGGAVQYKFEKTLQFYLDNGFIREVK